ncbi:MAG: acetamidase/formamidase family protein, partial [Bryobacteraceae bacterium]
MTNRIFTLLIVAACPGIAADLSGNWIAQVTRLGESRYARVTLRGEGSNLTGTWGQSKIQGTIDGDRVKFSLDGRQAGTFIGAIDGAELSGTGEIQARAGAKQSVSWKMTRTAEPPPGGPKTWDFEPKQFQAAFSGSIPPVLHIFPGDTVRTSLLDDAGYDAKSQPRAGFGNPETGPFYIEGALPGDTLVVKLNRVRVNRDSAQSGTSIKPNLVTPAYVESAKYLQGFDGEWKLDRAAGLATPAHPTARMKNYSVPIRP